MKFAETKRQKLYEAHAQKWFAEKGYFLPLTTKERDEILEREDRFPRHWTKAREILKQLIQKNQYDPKESERLRKEYAAHIKAMADDGYDTVCEAVDAIQRGVKGLEKWAEKKRENFELAKTVLMGNKLLQYSADQGSAASALQEYFFIAKHGGKGKSDRLRRALIQLPKTDAQLQELDKSLRRISQHKGRHYLLRSAFWGNPMACEMIGDYYNGTHPKLDKEVKKPLIALHFYTQAIKLTELGNPTTKIQDKIIAILENDDFAPSSKGDKEAARVLKEHRRTFTPKKQATPA